MIETIAILFAFLLAVIVLFVVALGAHWGEKRNQGLLAYMVYPMMLVYALSNLLSGRNLADPDDLAQVPSGKMQLVVWLGRLTSLFILFACGERIVHRLLNRKKVMLAGWLLAGFWLFYLTNAVSPALFGRHFYLSHEFLYVLVALWAALLVTETSELELIVVSVRNASLAFIVASLVVAVVRPHLAIATNYSGLIPLLHLRLSGLAAHANTMGSIVVFFLLCLWRRPFRWGALNVSSWLLAGLGLVLTQSKTNWIALLLSGAALLYFDQHHAIQRRLRDFRHPQLPVLVILALMFGGSALCLMFMFGSVGDHLARFVDTTEGASLISFSGRDQIWEIALQEWHKYPLFGYGLNIFDEAFRRAISLPNAVHAHSQFYQALASAGVVGAGGLVVYALVLLYYVGKSMRASEGLTLALFILLVCKAISEVPLALAGLSSDLINHVLLLAALSTFYRPGLSLRAGQASLAPAQEAC